MSTANKNLNIPANNTYINNWDIPMNTNFTGIDYALAGVCYISAAGRSGNITMGGSYSSTYPYPPENIGSVGTPTTSSSPSYIPSNIIISGGYSANMTFNVPVGIKGQWTVYNNATPTGSQTISFGVSGGDSVIVPVGQRVYVVSDGSDASYAQDPTITLGATELTLGGTFDTVSGLTLENSDVNDCTFENATINTGSINLDALDATGTPSSSTFLRGDGTWNAPTTSVNQIFPLTATGASNQITCTLDPTSVTFRSNTSTSGTTNTRSNASALTFTIPTDASLGVTSGQSGTIAILAYDNGSSMVLGCVNVRAELTESNLVNVSVVNGGTSAVTYYSSVTLSGAPYRVLGYIESTFTSGTGWNAPTLVQGAGGNSLSAFGGLGNGQVWTTTFVPPRATLTNYYNTTGRPIMVCVSAGNADNIICYVNDVEILNVSGWGHFSDPDDRLGASFIVPPNCSYKVDLGNIQLWAELR